MSQNKLPSLFVFAQILCLFFYGVQDVPGMVQEEYFHLKQKVYVSIIKKKKAKVIWKVIYFSNQY